MPLIKLTNQQIILVLGSNGYSSRTGTRQPLGALIPFLVGVGVALFLRSAAGRSSAKLPTPSKPAHRAK